MCWTPPLPLLAPIPPRHKPHRASWQPTTSQRKPTTIAVNQYSFINTRTGDDDVAETRTACSHIPRGAEPVHNRNQSKITSQQHSTLYILSPPFLLRKVTCKRKFFNHKPTKFIPRYDQFKPPDATRQFICQSVRVSRVTQKCRKWLARITGGAVTVYFFTHNAKCFTVLIFVTYMYALYLI